MADTTVLPVANYPAGNYVIPETAIGDSITSLKIAVQFSTTSSPTIWPNAQDTIRFDLEVWTPTNGWQIWNSPAIGSGGIHLVKGIELPAMYVEGTIPEGIGRKMRGSVTLSANIRTSCTITVL